MSILKFPKILVIHLKRFNAYGKIYSDIEIPEILNMG